MSRTGQREDSSRLESVNSFFDKESNYPGNNAVIEIRKEAVMEFTMDSSFEDAIDVACGEGSVAYAILDRIDKLTMLDLAPGMISRAKENLPAGKEKKTSFVQGDVLQSNLPEGHFDLIICTGLLAHVTSPGNLISKLSSLMKKDGMLILQNTNASHPYSFIVRMYRKCLSCFRKEHYPLNWIGDKELRKSLHENGLKIEDSYASMVSFLCLSPILSEKRKLSIIHALFGKVRKKRRQSLGHDRIYLIRKK